VRNVPNTWRKSSEDKVWLDRVRCRFGEHVVQLRALISLGLVLSGAHALDLFRGPGPKGFAPAFFGDVLQRLAEPRER
jgi:hypothetical protein